LKIAVRELASQPIPDSLQISGDLLVFDYMEFPLDLFCNRVPDIHLLLRGKKIRIAIAGRQNRGRAGLLLRKGRRIEQEEERTHDHGEQSEPGGHVFAAALSVN
jgi:hypothetical protein